MAYNALPSVSTGDLWTAAQHNTYLRDNFGDHETRMLAAESSIATLEGTGLFLIEEITLSSSENSITFDSIPNTYSDLVLTGIARTNYTGYNTDEIRLTVNNDSSTDYKYQYMQSFGTTHAASGGFGYTYIPIAIISGPTAPSNAGGSFNIEIPSYTNSNFKKQVHCFSSAEEATASDGVIIRDTWGVVTDTDVISRIDLAPGLGTSFIPGCSFRLYGRV